MLVYNKQFIIVYFIYYLHLCQTWRDVSAKNESYFKTTKVSGFILGSKPSLFSSVYTIYCLSSCACFNNSD